MADIILFGATGYTGKLTAAVLHRRGASFALAGRNRARLDGVAAETGDPDVYVCDADDPGALARAASESKVLITCVGPFLSLGDAAVEAALTAGVHYLDSTGEGMFIRRLIETAHDAARRAGIAMVPAMGFDEVPADVATTKAVAGMDAPDVVATYSVPSTGSTGTMRTLPDVLFRPGRRIEEGRPVDSALGDRARWAPMPPPLGPKPAISAPLASGVVVPRHLELGSFDPYVTIDPLRRGLLRVGKVPLKAFLASSVGRKLLDRALARLPEGPDDRGREKRWTILVEASDPGRWRNVVVQGSDMYGLTAECLAEGALALTRAEPVALGVLSPVHAFGLEFLERTLTDHGVVFHEYEGISG